MQSWILLLSPWIWTPFGLFCAMTQLIRVVLPAVWMPPPPVVEPEMELERTMQLSMSTDAGAGREAGATARRDPLRPTVFPTSVQDKQLGRSALDAYRAAAKQGISSP